MFLSNPTLGDFNHYLYAINEIRVALQSKLNILISGHSGCGKSNIVNMILTEKNFEVLNINSSTYDSLSLIKNRVTCFSKTNTISSFINKQSKIIFVDDLDAIMNIDRNFLSFVIDFIKSNQCKMICVNNSAMNKKILDTKGSFESVVVLKRLSYKQCFQIVIANIPETMDIDYDKLTILIKENNNDLRTVVNNIDDVQINRNVVDLNKRPKFLEMSIDDIVYELCTKILSEKEINEIVTHDINQIVSSLHENISQGFYTNSLDRDEISFIKEFNRIIINAEYIGKSIFDKYDFTTWDHYTYNKIKSLNHLLYNQFSKITKFKLSHSQLINKQSLALNFNKKLVKMEKEHNINRLDCAAMFFYIHTIIHSSLGKHTIVKLLSKNDFEIITRFLSDYFPNSKQQVLKLKNTLLK